MSRIPAIDPVSAQGQAAGLLEAVRSLMGAVPNQFRVAANAPAALQGLLGLQGALQNGGLPARVRAQIGITIAQRNGSDYCYSAHSSAGRVAGLSTADIAQALEATAADPHEAAILAFADTVMAYRGQVSGADVATARLAGVTDAEIIETIAQVALNFLTNALNIAAATEIDFPVARTVQRLAA
jgi:AhpD family alkylhydroperoxidase